MMRRGVTAEIVRRPSDRGVFNTICRVFSSAIGGVLWTICGLLIWIVSLVIALGGALALAFAATGLLDAGSILNQLDPSKEVAELQAGLGGDPRPLGLLLVAACAFAVIMARQVSAGQMLGRAAPAPKHPDRAPIDASRAARATPPPAEPRSMTVTDPARPSSLAVRPQAEVARGLPDVDELVRWAQQAARAGRPALAYRLFVVALELEPTHEEAWLWRAGTAANALEAERCLLHRLTLNPAHTFARRGLAELRARLPTPTTPGLGNDPEK